MKVRFLNEKTKEYIGSAKTPVIPRIGESLQTKHGLRVDIGKIVYIFDDGELDRVDIYLGYEYKV